MNHPNEDSLLKLRLEIAETEEARELQEHLAACLECRQRYGALENDLGTLEKFSLPPLHEHYDQPSVNHPAVNYLWRAAAILLVALSVGYVALFNYGQPVKVEPMRVALTPPPDSLQARLSCIAIELKVW